MEVELRNIIDKIKTEGVTEAEKQAEAIVKKARQEAKAVMQEAEKEKDNRLREAGEEAGKLKANAEEAVKQAARDTLLGLRESIIAMFDKIVAEKVSDSLSGDVVKEMVVKMVEGLSKKEDFEMEVLLSEDEKSVLEKTLLEELKKKALEGVIIKASRHMEKGFRIGEKGGNAYYDFSDEAIQEAFRTYLNPKMAELLAPRQTPGNKEQE